MEKPDPGSMGPNVVSQTSAAQERGVPSYEQKLTPEEGEKVQDLVNFARRTMDAYNVEPIVGEDGSMTRSVHARGDQYGDLLTETTDPDGVTVYAYTTRRIPSIGPLRSDELMTTDEWSIDGEGEPSYTTIIEGKDVLGEDVPAHQHDYNKAAAISGEGGSELGRRSKALDSRIEKLDAVFPLTKRTRVGQFLGRRALARQRRYSSRSAGKLNRKREALGLEGRFPE